MARVSCAILLLFVAFGLAAGAWVPPGNGGKQPGTGQGPIGQGQVQLPDGLSQSDDVKARDKKLSAISSALAFILICVPLAASIIGLVKMRTIHSATKKFVPRRDVEMPTPTEDAFSTTHGEPCTLSFADLNYWVQPPGGPMNKPPMKQILRNCSGLFEPGKLTAVMGPSGCGKTTLLTLLSGRGEIGEFSGFRALNGQQMPRSKFEEIMRFQGYVTQTDTFLEDLTVFDTLLYGALLRLPAATPLDDVVARVHAIISEVGLTNAATSKVGGATRKGISGGQRRRLAIALELLRTPSILLLDEPTSGLDATSSLKLVQTLRTLARVGNRTVVTTIHQPRAEIWTLFDQLVLLGENGETVYVGPTDGALSHLSPVAAAMGAPSAQTYDNPADFVIDTVGLDPERDEFSQSRVKLIEAWRRSGDRAAMLQDICGDFTSPRTFLPSKIPEERFKQLWALFARRVRRMSVDHKATAIFYTQIICVSLVIGFAFSYDSSTPWVTGPYKTVMFLLCIASYGMVLQYLVLIPEYFSEFPMLFKERASGCCSFASYVVACFLSETPRAVLQCLVLTAVSYATTALNPDNAYAAFFVICLTVGVCAWQGVMQVCSSLHPDIGIVYAIIFMLLGLGTLFGGIVITYEDIPPAFTWAYYTSVPAMTYRALMINDMACCHLTINCTDVFDSLTASENIQPPPNQKGQNGLNFLRNAACRTAALRPGSQGVVPIGTGDSLHANTGMLALRALDLADDSKYQALLFLGAIAIGTRIIAFLLLLLRARLNNRLKERTTDSGPVDLLQAQLRETPGHEMVVRPPLRRSAGSSSTPSTADV